jgi:alkanesulfonate monooxygenase SsuD/methylene tetrahydromethanopterin reductase-like flavin-dependent oxidoreductase (luciferase family)
MRIGAAFYLQDTDWPSLRGAVLEAEAAGFDSLWVDDHLLNDEGEPGTPKLEAWSVADALAVLTSRPTIGHLVTANTFRSPGLTAKLAITLDHLSAGRAVLGMGAGWFEREHRAFGLEFGATAGQRLERLDESVGIVRRLLDGERVDHAGPWYRLVDAVAAPRPIQSHLPILIGGMGPRRTIPLVARSADAWNAFGSPAEVAEKDALLVAHCARIGRDPATIERTVDLSVVIRDDRAAAEAAWGDVTSRHEIDPAERDHAADAPEGVAKVLRRYTELGFHHILWILRAPWDLETIRRMPEVRALLDG